ncbi:TylF/MycF family methyltransferase [Flavobacteriales bacterium]|nr:TylF/MycF family methyltransferase [Flavobacteriales bacterium]
MSQFGILSKLNFLQNWASAIIARINPAIIHNIEKYIALKKVHYLSAIEGIEGDYLEFGVFTGSSFCHSIRCCKKLLKINPNLKSTKFFGFDSFEGFGNLDQDDKHPFYTDQNFSTSFDKVQKRVRSISEPFNYKLIKGFFSDSLKHGSSSLGIKKSRVVFIDSDTYSSSRDAFNFVIDTIQEGTFIVLDDYYSYKGSEFKGVALAFNEFVDKGKFSTRHVLNYGMGGVVYIVSKIND